MPSRSSEYRKKLKDNDPVKYQEYLEKQKERNKVNRNKLKEDLKKKRPATDALEKSERQKELGRARQQKYLVRQKEAGVKPSTSATDSQSKTRNQLKTKKDLNREYKRKERAGWSSQKKTWVKKRDRDIKRVQRARVRHNQSDNGADVFNTKKTEWNATSKARASLPSDAKKYAAVIVNLSTNCTPRKRQALGNVNIDSDRKKKKINVELFSDTVVTLKSDSRAGKDAARLIAQKLVKKACFSKRFICKEFKMGRNAKLLGKRARRENVCGQVVRNFYKQDDISRILPQKRYATKDGPGYLMEISVKAALDKFRAEYPDNKICYAKFASLRPPNVRLLSTKYREYCVCVYCINIRYKLLTLSRLSDDSGKKHSCEKDILDILLCPKSDTCRFHQIECVQRRCPNCCNWDRTLLSYFDFPTHEGNAVWSSWLRGTDKHGKVKRNLITKTGSLVHLLDDFKVDILSPAMNMTFVQHIFTASWQYYQFSMIRNDVPKGWLLQVMDFAKNRNIFYEDEIKGAFYSPGSITMHPVISFYRTEMGIVRNAVIVFSDDHGHDHHAVDHYTNKVDAVISKEMTTKVKVIFSDGCAAQYKSSGPMADVSLKGYNISRNYYGSEHGKGEGDGEIGVVNRALDRAISGRKAIIRNAKDAYVWCCNYFVMDTPLSKRSFLYAEEGDVERKRPYTQIKTITQTRKIHQARNKVGKPYTLFTRELSCFCKSCCKDTENGTFSGVAACRNMATVGPFTERILHALNTAATDDQPPELTIPVDVDDLIDEILGDATSYDSTAKIDCSKSGETTEEHETPQIELNPDMEMLNQCLNSAEYPKIECGTYVAVKLKPSKTSVFFHVFLAKVTKVLGEEVDLRYMIRCGDNVYMWPEEEDQEYSRESVKDSIVCSLSPPDLLNAREQYRFNDIHILKNYIVSKFKMM